MKNKLKKIKMIVLDVDGVLTDAGLMIGHDGFEYMKFNIQDGAGIVLARKLGYQFALITGRNTQIITRRAEMLGIEDVYQNKLYKMDSYEDLLKKYKLKDEEVCYVGDDILDLPILMRVGFSAVPSDAVPDVKKYVDYVAKRKGGEGAVREVIDLILEGAGVKKKLIQDVISGNQSGKPV
ncbi:MAG: HAD hydrolase family protein [Deltaproteobacteria bacterium]|nr:HAD hydrolase family protein [Deltaproteobacteria bacterium]